MADLKNRMINHVKAAKLWLGKAEQSFDQENEIRGDLNLMLAEAELKRARETKAPSEQGNRRAIWLMHGVLASGLAALILFVGLGGLGSKEARPVQASVSSNAGEPLNQIDAAPGASPKEQMASPRVSTESAAAQRAEMTEDGPKIDAARERAADRAPLRAEESQVNMPPAQMQQLMRAAGKSLRGQ